MGLNVSTSMGFENRDFLKNTAKNILNNGGASDETAEKIINKTIFNEQYQNSSLSILKASAQISINDSLKETLKYLRAHANKREIKKPVLGELWNLFESTNQEYDEKQYESELYDFQLDSNIKNIFAA